MCVFLNLSSLSPTVWPAPEERKRFYWFMGEYVWLAWFLVTGAGTWGSLSHPGCKQWAESTGWMQPDYIESSRPTLKGQLSPGSTTSLNSSSKHKSQCRRVHIQSRTVVHTCFKKQQKEKNEAQSSVAPQLTHVKERRKGLFSCSQCLIAKNGCVFL